MKKQNPFDYYPQRIICLTEETTETLYLLGEQHRIVGISGFTNRPLQARKEKPKISTFLDANIDEILQLKPDLVIGFSDIQAGIAKKLIEKGISVWINNHRSVDDIMRMIVQLGALVGKADKAIALVNQMQNDIQLIQEEVAKWNVKPRVYFEEWFDPLITGIQWVSELIEIAGGEVVLKDKSSKSLAKDRILSDPGEVILKNPDIILASWCGKMFKKDKMLGRNNWASITAIQKDDVYEIKSDIILQPGPAALTEGLKTIHSIFKKWAVLNRNSQK